MLVAASLAVLAASAAGARAGLSGFTSPTDLGPFETEARFDARDHGPRLAVDSRDRATVVWQYPFDDPATAETMDTRTRWAWVAPDGGVRRSRFLSQARGIHLHPEIAIDGVDRAWALRRFLSLSSDSRSLPGHLIFPGGDTEPAGVAPLGPDQHFTAGDPRHDVAIGLFNGVYSGWSAVRVYDEGIERISTQKNVLPAGRGAIGGPGPLEFEVGSITDPQIALDSRSQAAVVWGGSDPGQFGNLAEDGIWVQRVNATGTPGWTFHTDNGEFALPDVAVDSRDRIWVVWKDASNGIRGLRLAPDGTAQRVWRVATSGFASTGEFDNTSGPRVAIDSLGRAWVTWKSGSAQGIAVFGDGFSRSTSLPSSTIDGDWPYLAIDSRDRAFVVWSGGASVRAARVQALPGLAGNPRLVRGPVRQVGAGSLPQLAIDSRDRAFVTFVQGGRAKVARAVLSLPRIVIRGRRLRLNRGRYTRVRLRCPASGPDPRAGRITVRTRKRVSFGGKRRRVELASSKYEIPAGETRRVRIRLSRGKAKLVRRTPRARDVKTIATVEDAEGDVGRAAERMRLAVG